MRRIIFLILVRDAALSSGCVSTTVIFTRSDSDVLKSGSYASCICAFATPRRLSPTGWPAHLSDILGSSSPPTELWPGAPNDTSLFILESIYIIGEDGRADRKAFVNHN